MLPVTPTRYPQFWRAPGLPAWRPIVAALVGAAMFLVVSTVVTLVAVFVEAYMTGTDLIELINSMAEGSFTPGIVFANSLGLALLVPVAFLLGRIAGQRPGYLSSVVGHFRWRWFWPAVGVALVGIALYTGISVLIDGVDSLGLQVFPYSWWLFLGLMLVTPFQAAAEEYLLRGVLLRTVGSWIPSDRVAFVVAAVVSSGVFMSLHAASDPWLNVFYFTMGMLLAWLTWRTGGLEAAVAVHVANNMIGMAFVPFQDIDALFDRGEGAGSPAVLIQLVFVAAIVVVVELMARRRGIEAAGPRQ